MLATLAAAFLKDLRLLARDRVGLIFLTLAPIIVITVAGFSLASLYGADPKGQTAYLLPLADEDGGRVGRAIRSRLASSEMVQVRLVPNREEAAALVRDKTAGVALVIPSGASRTLASGGTPNLVLLTDPVKYLEVASVRALVQELRHGIESAARDRAARRLARLRTRMLATREDFERADASLSHELDALAERLKSAHAGLEARAEAAEAGASREIRATLRETADRQLEVIAARVATELVPLKSFVHELEAKREEFARWYESVRRRAGRYADRLPPPPAPPAIPPQVIQLATLDTRSIADRLAGRKPIPLPHISFPRLPTAPLPALPTVTLPSLPELPPSWLPGTLGLEETSITGAPVRINSFDQNVPGFSVTFLLLGMLLGVSLGLLDERDWGTLARLRATPAGLDVILVAKLLARFAVGVVQMVVLLAVGRVLFGISLGPEPWALLLPTAGIVFAGTAFGLVVAGLANSREAVLPLGSIVIVTMAAVGGCWWPIDLEPHWMQKVALAFPTTWAMAAYNDLMIRRQPLAAALQPTLVLFAYGGIYLALGLALFRRRVS